MNTTQRFHTYELTFAALAAAGGFANLNFLVEADYDFLWMKAQAFIYDANGLGISTLQLPNLEVLLSDGSSAQQLMNQATSINNIFGNGEIPFILPMAHRVNGGKTFNATVTNRHAATVYSVRLAFSGMHVFRGAGLPQRRAA